MVISAEANIIALGSSGDAPLQQSNTKAFNERASQDPTSEAPREYSRAEVYENTAGDRFHLVTGNLGVEPGYVSSFNGTSTVHHNTMGSDAKIFTGDIGGQTANEMLKLMFGGASGR